jgi:hypothetical protein
VLLSWQLVREYGLAINVVSCDIGRHFRLDGRKATSVYGNCETEMDLKDEVLLDRKFLSYLLTIFRQLYSNTQLNFSGGQTIVPRIVSDLGTRLLDFGTNASFRASDVSALDDPPILETSEASSTFIEIYANWWSL